MKILILATDIYTRGGIARYSWTLASALGELIGPDNVHVLALLGSGQPQATPKDFRILDPDADRPTVAAKIRFAGKALQLARKGCHLTICTHVALAPIAAAIRQLRGTPYWVACHGTEVWPRLPWPERLALRHADRVLAISRFTAERVARVNGVSQRRIVILYNAIPDEFARLLTCSDQPPRPAPSDGQRQTILSVGMLSKALSYKGFDMVIRALPKVIDALPGVRYVIAGDGDDRENLRKLAFELGIGEHVEFKGEVSDDELAALYRASDVFVLPSRVREENGNWQGEGFGRVYVEAALAGKPVIGSTHGGAAEAVLHGRTGLLVDPTSVSQVGDALLTLLRDADLATGMGRQGRSWARRKFTQEALRSELAGLIDDTASRVPSPGAAVNVLSQNG